MSGDAHHKRAAKLLRDLPASDSLVTTDYVFDETITRVRRVAGHSTAVAVGQALRTSSLARIEAVTPSDVAAAWDLFERYDDHELSFTDCVSFAFCDRLGLKTAFTFDDDFETHGLRKVP